MSDIVNLQTKIRIPDGIEEFVRQATDLLPESRNRSASIAFVSDEEIRNLNKEFRKIDSVTDVLSFPYKAEKFEKSRDHLGDIVISAERAKKQAKDNGLTLEIEIRQLILHGILHLCGYDHDTDDGKMNSLELELRDKLNIDQ